MNEYGSEIKKVGKLSEEEHNQLDCFHLIFIF